MARALATINSVVGSNVDFTIDAVAQLDNSNEGGESTFLWSLLDQPVGATDSLSDPNIKNPTLRPKKEGTYVVQLTVNQGTGTEDTDVLVLAVKQLKTRRRVPGASETTQAEATKGWSGSLNEILRDVDSMRADPGFVVGIVGASGLQRGAICKVEATDTIKTGLPGEETMPKFTRALATSAANVRGLIGILISDVNGSTTPASGSLCYFRIFGLIGNFTGAPTVADPVFVNDAGDFSLTEGTYRRCVGFVASSSGGTYRIWYDGRLLDSSPEFVAVDVPNSGTVVGASGKARLRGSSGRLQQSRGGGPYHDVIDSNRVFAELSGDATTTSGTWVDLLVANITVGTPGIVDILTTFSGANSDANEQVYLRLLVDGAPVNRGAQFRLGSGAIAYRKTGLSAAAHSVTVQWYVSGGVGMIRPVASVDTDHLSLLVEEVGT